MKSSLLALFVIISISVIGQEKFDDTIYYKSGLEKPVEISKFDTKIVYYSYKNSRDEIKVSQAKRKAMKYFVQYENGEKVYDSRNASGVISSGETHTEELKHNDTIFFITKDPQVCYITRYSPENVFYNYFVEDGGIDHTSKSTNGIKRFVIYDENDKLIYDSGDIEQVSYDPNQDSVLIAKHNLSLNPLGLGVVAPNIQYTYRFGPDLKFGIRPVARVLSPLLWDGFYLQTGVGFVFFPVNNERYSFTVGATPSMYFFSGNPVLGLPLTLGFVRYISNKLSLNGNLGLGPGISLVDGTVGPAPQLHLGIGFQIGKKELINASKLN